MNASERTPHRDAPIEDQAADWLVRRDAGLSAAQAAALQAWLGASAEHARVFRELEAAWRTIQAPRRSGDADRVIAELEARSRARARRRRHVFTFAATSLAAAAAIACAVLLPWREIAPRADPPAAVTTSAGRPERRTLPDGSVVELNAGAEIRTEFTARRRGIQLLRGEAHFQVAKDPARPFVVAAGGVAARAVGTEFVVRYRPDEVMVLVTEGVVAVDAVEEVRAPAAAPVPLASAPLTLTAGNVVVVPLAAGSAPQFAQATLSTTPGAVARPGKRVEFTGTPLADALALFNRENTLQLALADPADGALRVSGVFWTNNPEAFAWLLETTFGLRASRAGPDTIVLGR